MDLTIFNQFLIIIGLSIFVQLACNAMRVPTIVGFLVTGVLAGPSGFGLIKGANPTLIEIGVVLLMFSIGLEFSFDKLVRIRRAVFLGGAFQVFVTILVTFVLARPFTQSAQQALFYGYLIALSSTAILMKLLQERGETDAPHGRISIGVAIFQDMIVIAMMLSLPLLAGPGVAIDDGHGGHAAAHPSAIKILLQALGIILMTILLARYLVPWLFRWIARTRSRELFLLTVLATCFGVPWMTLHMGLSLGIGAFLAGLIISETEYSHQALAGVLPFKDFFTSLFFILIGVLFNVEQLAAEPLAIILLTVVVLLIKTLVATGSAQILGYPLRSSLSAGLLLSNIGEFSFVLAGIGLSAGLIHEAQHQRFIGVSILSMAATPVLLALARPLTRAAEWLPIPRRLIYGLEPVAEPQATPLTGHLIIIGFGVIGRNVARAARSSALPYIVIEMNHETVHRERAAGETIIGGDATQEAVLEHARIHHAAVVLVAVPDPGETRKITHAVRRLNPSAQIIARTRYVSEIDELLALGANDVVPDEFEASIEIGSRVLHKFLLPRPEIEERVARLRTGCYQGLRQQEPAGISFDDLRRAQPDHEVASLRLAPGSELVGRTLAEADLRRKLGVTLLAIRRGGEIISNPAGNEVLHEGDILVLFGPTTKLGTLADLTA